MSPVRSVAVALPVSALPSRFAIGDLGPAAHAFVRQLAAAGIRYWQILPWGPTTPGLDNSPYNALSAFAGNPLWISPELLLREGICGRAELERLRPYTPRIDYEQLMEERQGLLQECFERLPRRHVLWTEFESFCEDQSEWLDVWACFASLREMHRGMPWSQWEAPYRRYHPGLLRELQRRCARRLHFHRWVQFLFFRQLELLRQWCCEHGVELIGDMPLFVAYDSAEVWAYPEYFLLADDGCPEYLSGAPPDVFNPEGQLWGHPLYRWETHRREHFRWWCQRVAHVMRFVRWLRLDHFRGYAACWAVPRGSGTAARGVWLPSPGEELLHALQRRWMPLPFLPEDLGTITPEVELLRQRFELPTMRVLLFAFPHPERSPHAPHRYSMDCVAYTSLHDTPPVRGWFTQQPEEVRRSVARYCGRRVREENVSREFLRLALQSAAWLVVVAAQDLCALGAEAQLNRPGTLHGNWRWRLPPGMPHMRQWSSLAELSTLYGRSALP
ncbi:4-alpha-glucanotransferase [bacterium HR21]|nr:4-alpha-glucanotransferase [bacterium HR21]